jgi:H2-forming N5,N10-methylenetetrahydromethanopterin dehydrogenase-like enzyme
VSRIIESMGTRALILSLDVVGSVADVSEVYAVCKLEHSN